MDIVTTLQFALLLVPLAFGCLLAVGATRRADRMVPWIELPFEGCHPQPLRFDGTAGRYAFIWITSQVLSLLTLTLYGPWGKVRENRYLYGHTAAGRRRFSYLGNPWSILVGRLLLVGGLAVFTYISSKSSIAHIVLTLLGSWVGVPWLAQRAFVFKARTGALAGVPFRFAGTFGGAFWAYVLAPAGNLCTLGLASPFFTRYVLGYRYNQLSWGTRRIRIDVSVGDLYLAKPITFLVSVGPFVAAWAYKQWKVDPMLAMLKTATPPPMAEALPVGAVFVFLVACALVPAYMVKRALETRLVLSGLAIEGVGRLECELRTGRTVFVALTNAAACLLSLGLLTPWAQVRWLKVLTASVVLHALPAERPRDPAQPPVPKVATDEIAAALLPLDF